MNICENLSDQLFTWWKAKTNIAIDLDLLIEDLIYQAQTNLGTFIIKKTESKSGMNEFFRYDFDIKEINRLMTPCLFLKETK